MLGAAKSPASLDVCVLTHLLGGCARRGRRRTRAGAAVLPARARLALRSPAVGATRRTLGTACVLLAHGTHAARTLHVRAMHTACECACTLHMHRAGVAWRPGPPRLPLPRHRHVATWTAVRRRDLIFISIIPTCPTCIVLSSVGPHIPPERTKLAQLVPRRACWDTTGSCRYTRTMASGSDLDDAQPVVSVVPKPQPVREFVHSVKNTYQVASKIGACSSREAAAQRQLEADRAAYYERIFRAVSEEMQASGNADSAPTGGRVVGCLEGNSEALSLYREAVATFDQHETAIQAAKEERGGLERHVKTTWPKLAQFFTGVADAQSRLLLQPSAGQQKRGSCLPFRASVAHRPSVLCHRPSRDTLSAAGFAPEPEPKPEPKPEVSSFAEKEKFYSGFNANELAATVTDETVPVVAARASAIGPIESWLKRWLAD